MKRQSRPNVLAGPYLERFTEWRSDENRMRAALEDPRTLLVPVWRTKSLIAQTVDSIVAHFVTGVHTLAGVDTNELILLGEFRNHCCFAYEVPADSTPEIEPGTGFHDLRSMAGELPREEAGLLAYARALILWRERHRYCGRCGSRNAPTMGGHVLRCTRGTCGISQFPRIDPAVIVLITDGERALLGRQAAWPAGRYSTIAGFVEPGESLEDAVVREVREETGVQVDDVQYHSSQPWPFPSSLMLGFTAHAGTTDIHLIDAELEDARWLTRTQITTGEVSLPPPHSISFRLIEDWYDAQSPAPLRTEPKVQQRDAAR